MKAGILTASLLALSLFAAASNAQDAPDPDNPSDAPAEVAPPPADAPAAQPAAEVPPEVLALISDSRPPSELSNDELQSRVQQARQFARGEGVPRDLQRQLQQIARDARAELMAREQKQQAAPAEDQAPPPPQPETPAAQQAAPAPEASPPPAPQPDVAQEAEQPQEKKRSSGEGLGGGDDNQGGAMPRAVAEMLRDGRAASELNDQQLQRRIDRLQQFLAIDGLPQDAGSRLKTMQAEAVGEHVRRQQTQAQQPAPSQPEQPGSEQPPAAELPGVPPEISQLVRDERPAARLNQKQLEDRIGRIRSAETVGGLPPDVVARLAVMKREAEVEWMARQQAQEQQQPPVPPKPPVAEAPAPQPAPAPQQPSADRDDIQQLDANQVDPRMEDQARRYLSVRNAERMNDQELRQRLDEMRELLASNRLSRESERALRRQVAIERQILRERVAEAEADRIRRDQQRDNRRRNRYWAEEAPADWDWAVRDVLNDRRRSEDLRTYELRRRLEVLRQAAADRRYGPEYRQYWRAVIDRDQYVLGLRLVELRRKRQAQIDDLYAGEEDFDIGANMADEDVFAAEVDDEQLQDVLIARPRKKFNRRFTIEEIEQNDEVRAALPRVEVDTVRFGFNEAFVRPEEIDKLDRIGEILERILRKNPREVFLIEGHTDAVGSDAANLALSRKRAEAVKKALTTYYVIPSRALRTVGYGERYLKIPTAEAEGENRRVSVSRATDLIGQLQ